MIATTPTLIASTAFDATLFNVTSRVGGTKTLTVRADTAMQAWCAARREWNEETPSGLSIVKDAKGVQAPWSGFSLACYPYPKDRF
jgi:hypothetical protein